MSDHEAPIMTKVPVKLTFKVTQESVILALAIDLAEARSLLSSQKQLHTLKYSCKVLADFPNMGRSFDNLGYLVHQKKLKPLANR